MTSLTVKPLVYPNFHLPLYHSQLANQTSTSSLQYNDLGCISLLLIVQIGQDDRPMLFKLGGQLGQSAQQYRNKSLQV